MTNIDKHSPGAFCWIELATTDQPAAKTFYSSLFGWTSNDTPMGPNDVYTVFQLQGRAAAAAYTMRPEQRSQGIPPNWMLYIAVKSADESANAASNAGGKILMPPFDVFDLGRMAIIQDPTGAVFAIWQAKKQAGTGITAIDGTLCWADLNTRDQVRARQFYSKVFGWEMVEDTDDKPPSGYVHIKNGADFIGGIPPAEYLPPNVPPHWMPYFQVPDCDASTNKTRQLGGQVCAGPITLENVGRFTVVSDAQGAAFALFQQTPPNK